MKPFPCHLTYTLHYSIHSRLLSINYFFKFYLKTPLLAATTKCTVKWWNDAWHWYQNRQQSWWPTFFLVAFKTDISRELSWKVQRKIIQQLFCWGITLRPLSIYYWSLVDVAKTIQRYMIVKGNTNRLLNNNLGTTLIWIIFNFINHQ